MTIIDIAKKIGKKIEVDDMIRDPRNYKASNKKILNEDFEFKFNIDKGIEEINSHPNDLKNYKSTKYSNHKLMILRNLSLK